jgi:hypothetical protein
MAAHYEEAVTTGVEYFFVKTLDPEDQESVSMMPAELAPRMRVKLSN